MSAIAISPSRSSTKSLRLGFTARGRNSGVLHAGIYYPPGTLKAQVCVQGARRLRAWCEAEELPVLACGKVIAPQAAELDDQLELLLERGIANGADVRLIDEQEFHQRVPDGRITTGRALWSPNTCVVKPKQVLKRPATSHAARRAVCDGGKGAWCQC